ncbi:DUF2071 domain-containing protein [Paenibacillus sp. 7124]|uniref:DUF2071 domain-containing protein n=1 Tax=Paenibacillus apii TaxID=1850370 RepID=A0A6M1PMY5_9BACL|nr:DUF2071 domain-containing protein [Paenibacillus apii]NGM84620.1 DUF2071 domain-containing protein [Paenibacillus apii]NJJ42015.1 DUF2071 domain-containing protein [Paenibacillus apii]
MDNREILVHTNHRPYPLPKGSWAMKQGWNHLLFAHWPADERELLPYVPSGLELDKWQGMPWISMSPFLVNPLRLRGIPPLPLASRFLELNVRTYVIRNGKPGVLFLGLEASSRPVVLAARWIGHLPYHHADMKGRFTESGVSFTSSRRTGSQQAAFSAEYQAAGGAPFHARLGTLLYWLTERYCLYTSDLKGRLYEMDIHHLPWPLQESSVHLKTNTLAEAYRISLDSAPSAVTFTDRLDALIWPLKEV